MRILKTAVNGLFHFGLLSSLVRKSFSSSLINTLRSSHGDAEVLRDSLRFIDQIDAQKFAEIASAFRRASPGTGFSKYLDDATHLARSVRSARWMGLHDSDSLSILDIGSGAGYFPFVCRGYGHQALALDTGDNDMYDRLRRLLQIPVMIHRVEAGKPLPVFPSRFDLMTCFQTVFDQKPDGKPWQPLDWDFFISEARARLNLNGRLVIGLNTVNKKDGDVRALNLEFFRGRGAVISGSDVLLRFP